MTDELKFWPKEEVLYDDPEGRFILTKTEHDVDGETITLVHFEIFYFRPSVLRELDRIFDQEREKLPPIIGAMARSPSKTHATFMRRFGFEQVPDVPCTDGTVRPFWVHFL